MEKKQEHDEGWGGRGARAGSVEGSGLEARRGRGRRRGGGRASARRLVAHEEGVQNGDDVHVYVGVAKEGKGEKREGRMEDGLAKEERKEGRKLTQTE